MHSCHAQLPCTADMHSLHANAQQAPGFHKFSSWDVSLLLSSLLGATVMWGARATAWKPCAMARALHLAAAHLGRQGLLGVAGTNEQV